MRSLGIVALFVGVAGCALEAVGDDRPEASAGSPSATGGAGAGAGGSDQARGGSVTSGGGAGRSSGGAGGQVEPPTAGTESDGGEDTGAAGRSDGDGGEDAVAGRGGSGRGGTSTTSGTGGTGGDAGSGSDPDPCDECPATHECIGGECFIRPECDCEAFGVECSPLSSALKADFACPVEVQCGECEPNHLCAGYTDPARENERFCAAREFDCLTITEWRQEGYSGPTPTCPIPNSDSRCSEAYAFCSMPIYLTEDGAPCPAASAGSSGVYWTCGPPPT
jgi:hypothetical protein